MSNYSSCTASSFVVDLITVYWDGNNYTQTLSPLLSKSYTASTGVLTLSVPRGTIKSVAIYKPIITVGTSSSGSITVTSKVSNYASCSEQNFVVEASSAYGTGNAITQTFCPVIIKSYNASTGVLTFNNRTSFLRIDSATVYYVG